MQGRYWGQCDVAVKTREGAPPRVNCCSRGRRRQSWPQLLFTWTHALGDVVCDVCVPSRPVSLPQDPPGPCFLRTRCGEVLAGGMGWGRCCGVQEDAVDPGRASVWQSTPHFPSLSQQPRLCPNGCEVA